MAEKFSFFGAVRKAAESPAVKRAGETARKANDYLDKPAPQMTRRQVLGGILAAGVAGSVIDRSLSIEEAEGSEVEEPQADRELQPEGLRTERRRGEAALYDMGPLAGRRVGGLFAFYLGLPEGSTVPEQLSINFDTVLANLWEKKLDFVRERKPEVLDNITRARDQYLAMYQERQGDTGMSLAQLVGTAQATVDTLHSALDWDELSEHRSVETDFTTLEDSDVELVKTMARVVSGKTLIAYSMTELMPALQDAEMNVNMYEFLLEQAGEEFLSAVPAIYDVKLSLGPGQFTEYAVYDMGGPNKRGASVINTLLPENLQIGGSVVTLRTMEQHLRAAYLFAIYNLTRLVNAIRRQDGAGRRLAVLREEIENRPIALLQFIASAHNNPGDGIGSFISWIDDRFQGSHADRARHTGDYIRKSNVNFKELDRRV